MVSPRDIELISNNIQEEEFYMGNQNNSMGGFGVGLLVGAAVGVSLALLYAPYSGQKTRRLIREDAEDVWNAGSDQIQESRESVNDLMDNARQRADRVIARAKCRAATE
jgi:gas vesicle protein